MIVTDGAQFGMQFNSEDVAVTPWGSVRIQFNDCDTATISYTSLDENFASGTQELTRLTSGPVDYKGACQLN